MTAERVERTGGLRVHHPGPPPLGKPLIVSKVDVPGRYVSNEEVELLGPPVLDAAWWAAWRDYAAGLGKVEESCHTHSTRTTQTRR